MPTVNEITTTPLSGLNYIDALLDKGPDWNYVTAALGAPANTLYYTFSVASGNEDSQSTTSIFTGGIQAFGAFQQQNAKAAFAYLSEVTGIKFVETQDGTNAQIHLANANLINPNTTGLCSWHSAYSYSSSQLTSYSANAYVYLDNVEWNAQNSVLAPGGYGYETLLHELGHALGLKHPFVDGPDPGQIVLPVSQDSTYNTLMSYNYVGGPYSSYRQDDLAALAWLYGGDGLGGALGIDSTTGGRYLMGSSGNDTLIGTTADDTFQGNGGDDMIYGGGGNDTAVFTGASGDYNIKVLANGDLQVVSKDGSEGLDTLDGINTLNFLADHTSISHQAILAASSPPVVPTLNLVKDANDYVAGSTPSVTGRSDPGDTIKIYTADNVVVGTVTADSSGFFSLALTPFKDGTNYHIYATATDSSGVTSAASQPISFNVDAHMPSMAVTKNAHDYATGDTPVVNGIGVPGDVINIYTSDNILVGTTTADSTTGVFSTILNHFKDGSGYQVYATATSSGGAVSGHSQPVTFNIDAHAPGQPTAHLSIGSGDNQATFSGMGEPGTTIELIRTGATAADYVEIAQALVGNNGLWSVTTPPMPDGTYTVVAVSVDLADNVTNAASRLTFNVSNPGNMIGTDGGDVLHVTQPNIAIDGGAGSDTVVVDGPRANYTLAKDTWGVGLVDNVGSGGHDTLLNVERVHFSDGWVALDVNGNTGDLCRLYQAAFGRASDADGLGFWMWRMETGSSLLQVAHEFMTNQPEYDRLYGANASDMDFVNHLYQNVLHRSPDAAGFAFWIDGLKNDPNARAQILVDFAESPENKALLIGTLQDGVTFIPHHT